MACKKVVICPAKVVEGGKLVQNHNNRPPYDHHHINSVGHKGEFTLVSTVDSGVDIKKTKKIAKIIVGSGLPIEIDPDFYKNME